MSVLMRFSTFHKNILLTHTQLDKGEGRRKSVVKALNLHYRGSFSETDNSLFIGSRAKHTSIRPTRDEEQNSASWLSLAKHTRTRLTRDVDVLYVMPFEVYARVQSRTGNKQSQLMQEVRGVLQTTFQSADIKGEGPVIKVPFTTFNVELIPAFKLDSGSYWVCFTSDGGFYMTADYDAELDEIKISNDATGGKTCALIRMMKKWQEHCHVPMKSFWIELLVIEFLQTWEYRDKGWMYYDWMVRDFFSYLKEKNITACLLQEHMSKYIWGTVGIPKPIQPILGHPQHAISKPHNKRLQETNGRKSLEQTYRRRHN